MYTTQDTQFTDNKSQAIAIELILQLIAENARLSVELKLVESIGYEFTRKLDA